jgi:hypothetical protein
MTQIINSVPGVKYFYIKDEENNTDSKLNLFIWNPLYANEDNIVISQSYKCAPFEYPYFYNLSELANQIEVIDE